MRGGFPYRSAHPILRWNGSLAISHVLRGLLVISVWAAGFGGLFYWGSRGCMSRIDCAGPVTLPALAAREDQFGPIQYIRYDPASFSVLYFIKLTSVTSTPKTVGLFRTAAYRTVILEQVFVAFYMRDAYEHTLEPATMQPGQLRPGARAALAEPTLRSQYPSSPWAFLQADLAAFQERQASAAGQGKAPVTIDYGLPDLGHVTDIEIRHFECHVHRGRETLHISSRSGSWSATRPNEMILRGHVTLRNGKTTLEGNLVRWDFQEQQFRAETPCFVRTPDRAYMSETLHCDMTMKTL
jgi:hypothetical protein